MIFEAFDVVVVPFPFTDRAASRRRPAVALSTASFGAEAGHSIFAMITTARQSSWPLDVAIDDLAAAGLSVSCFVRMKLFTLDHRLIVQKRGRLRGDDAMRVGEAIRHLFWHDGGSGQLAELTR